MTQELSTIEKELERSRTKDQENIRTKNEENIKKNNRNSYVVLSAMYIKQITNIMKY